MYRCRILKMRSAKKFNLGVMTLEEILRRYKNGETELAETLQQLSGRGIDEMGFATIDTDRMHRTGLPEVIYASGKTTEQVAQIAKRMYDDNIDILATRVKPEMYDAVKKLIPGARYNEMAKTITYKHTEPELK